MVVVAVVVVAVVASVVVVAQHVEVAVATASSCCYCCSTSDAESNSSVAQEFMECMLSIRCKCLTRSRSELHVVLKHCWVKTTILNSYFR